MIRIVVSLIILLSLQSCVKEVPSPFYYDNGSTDDIYMVPSSNRICIEFKSVHIVFEDLLQVDSVQWIVDANISFQVENDTLIIDGFFNSGDSSIVELLVFLNSDTLEEHEVKVFDCFQPVYFPNSFTPNEDGVNDEWRPIFQNIHQLNWSIHADDGSVIMENQGQPNATWDGSWNSSPAPQGLYRYNVAYQSIRDSITVRKDGWLQLLRPE